MYTITRRENFTHLIEICFLNKFKASPRIACERVFLAGEAIVTVVKKGLRARSGAHGT